MSVASKNLNIMNRRGTVRAKTLIVKSVTEVLRYSLYILESYKKNNNNM